jgi:hypothetical protein
MRTYLFVRLHGPNCACTHTYYASLYLHVLALCCSCCKEKGRHVFVGLFRTVYIHRIWPYICWFPCQKYCVYTVYILYWPTLCIRVPGREGQTICIGHDCRKACICVPGREEQTLCFRHDCRKAHICVPGREEQTLCFRHGYRYRFKDSRTSWVL